MEFGGSEISDTGPAKDLGDMFADEIEVGI